MIRSNETIWAGPPLRLSGAQMEPQGTLAPTRAGLERVPFRFSRWPRGMVCDGGNDGDLVA